MLVITITAMIKPITWRNLFGLNKPHFFTPHYFLGNQILGGALRGHLCLPAIPTRQHSPNPYRGGFNPQGGAADAGHSPQQGLP